MNTNVRTIAITVVLLALIGGVTLASIRDGNTERLVMFGGSVLGMLAALYSAQRADQAATKVEEVAKDVTEVKHQTNGKLTELVDSVKDAVSQQGAAVPSSDGTVQGTTDRQAR